MCDLISRKAAIDKFEPWLRVDGYSEGEINMLKAALYELRNLPPAQPEIIRCCECVHWNQDAVKQNKSFCDNYEYDIWTDWTAADWYCADAERRTNE